MTPLDRLLAKVDPLFKSPPFDEKALPAGMKLHKSHRELLNRRNGGYFFGGALHLFGAANDQTPQTLLGWNEPELWRTSFGSDAFQGISFFAEDAFGNQFGLDASGKVFQLRSEQGILEELADDFDQWLLMAVEAPDELLSRPTFARWVALNGRLPYGCQLQAYPPFLFAEEPELVQLSAVDAAENMQFHGALAQQLASIPEGVRVKVEFTDDGIQITQEPVSAEGES